MAQRRVGVTRRERLRYWFDDYMSRGSRSTFAALVLTFLAAFFLIALLRLIALAVIGDIDVERGVSGTRQLYITFLELTDPGSMTQDIESSAWVKVFAILSGVVGLVLLSSLIALLTTAVDGRLQELRKGHSKVVLSDHTLVLGWNDRVLDVLRELILANESEDEPSIVILADRPKEEMDDILSVNLSDTRNTKVVTRSGSTSALVNLGVVAAECCKSIIVLADCNVGASASEKRLSDLEAVKTLLAITSSVDDDHDVPIVAEIFNPSERALAHDIDPARVVCIDADDVLAKMIVQTSRSSGLAVVYEEMLSFDGAELYFHHDEWGEATFGELQYRFPDGVALGYRRGDEICINPDPNAALDSRDEVLILASDDSAIELRRSAVVEPLPGRRVPGEVARHVERQLVIGFSPKFETIAREYADYVLDGSQIDVVLRRPSAETQAEIRRIDDDLPTMTIRVVADDAVSAEMLLELRPFEYDNIIILSQAATGGAADWTDSETLLILLQLQQIFRTRPQASTTKLIAEILDSRNRELVARTGVREFIISNSLISMMVAQVSENRRIQEVYNDLFAEEGSEIYLKSAGMYFDDLPRSLRFGDVMAAATARGEIALGVKRAALEDATGENFGVRLIPPKDEIIELGGDDSIVVVSEDET